MYTRVKTAELTVYSPVSEVQPKPSFLATRPTGLKGRVVGFLDESLSDGYFERLRELLEEQVGPEEILYWRKPNRSAPAPRAMMEEIVARCDAVVAATAH